MPTRELANLNSRSLKKFLNFIFKTTGISMTENKRDLIQGRMRYRIIDLDLKSFDEYYSVIEQDEKEFELFVDLITTHETYFFRTQRVWDYFSKEYLPKWYAENPRGWLRIWSAACSSGEESYTIAICCEEFKEKNPGFRYEVYSSDISQEMVNKARKGIYEGRSIDAFSKDRPELFEKYLEKSNNSYCVKESLSKNLKFFQHNLFCEKKGNLPFDLIFLRNVLIYFANEEKIKAIENIAKNMKDQSELIIGESESVTGLEVPFDYIRPSIYKKAA